MQQKSSCPIAQYPWRPWKRGQRKLLCPRLICRKLHAQIRLTTTQKAADALYHRKDSSMTADSFRKSDRCANCVVFFIGRVTNSRKTSKWIKLRHHGPCTCEAFCPTAHAQWPKLVSKKSIEERYVPNVTYWVTQVELTAGFELGSSAPKKGSFYLWITTFDNPPNSICVWQMENG